MGKHLEQISLRWVIPISMRTCGQVLHTEYRFSGATPNRLSMSMETENQMSVFNLWPDNNTCKLAVILTFAKWQTTV